MSWSGLDQIKDGWFTERSVLWPGQALSLEVREVLHHEKSKLQDILIFESATYGRVLVLDGVIQVTERDEFAYQEMLSHLALFAHTDPQRVLVVGGGDGGVVREVLKHASVREVVLCEIDARVVQLSQKFLPKLSAALDDPRVTIEFTDGAVYVSKCTDAFDVVITDSSDPVGPAKVLFEDAYSRAVHKCLREGGIAVSQGECMWLHLDLIAPLMKGCREIFAEVGYAYTTIPTYPSGQIGFILCAKSEAGCFKQPCRDIPPAVQENLRYYNGDIHRASFVLPEFVKRALCGK